MENFDFTRDLILVLGTAFFGGFLAKKLRQPLLTGYILGGVIAGSVLSHFISFSQNLGNVADIGAAFLMFTLGLEFSWEKFRKAGRGIIFATIAQILASILLGILVFTRIGFEFYPSVFLSACFSLSSTAVVVKILSDRGELDTLPGELSTAWLLLQDLAVLPMIVILPSLANPSISFFIWSFIKAVVLLVLVLVLGKRLVPYLTNKVLKTHSRELLLLWVISLCLILSFGAASIGLSFALGAFLAGFLVSEVGISASIFAEVRPLRDFFAVIFFVTLGFLTASPFLISHGLLIICLSIFLILLKLLLVMGLVLYLGYHTKTAFLTGFSLVSVGEFAFVLGKMGLNSGFISNDNYLLIISVTLLTLIISPWMISLAPILYKRIKEFSSKNRKLQAIFAKLDKKPLLDSLPFSDHIVICGYGRVGKYIGRALQMANIPFVVVEYNHNITKILADKGINVVYGDPAEIDVLDYAQVDKAKALVIAIPDRQTQEMVIANAQTLNHNIKIICRTHHEEDQAKLKALQVETIIQPEFEASLAIIHKLLSEFGASKDEIDGKITRLKIEHGM